MKSGRRKKPAGPARTRSLPDDACPRCGTPMVERRLALKAPVNGEEVSVPSALHLRCPRCDEVVLRFSDARRLQEDGSALYRKKHGLLSADEIRSIRERFGLTQSELARLLHLGANTNLALGVGEERADRSDGDAPATPTRPARKPRLPSPARGVAAVASRLSVNDWAASWRGARAGKRQRRCWCSSGHAARRFHHWIQVLPVVAGPHRYWPPTQLHSVVPTAQLEPCTQDASSWQSTSLAASTSDAPPASWDPIAAQENLPPRQVHIVLAPSEEPLPQL